MNQDSTQFSAPIAIADGSSFRDDRLFWFFDRIRFSVRSTEGLRRLSESHLGAEGLNVVAIEDLWATRTEAIDFAQKEILERIQGLRDRIVELELSKAKGDRSLKTILQARGL